jgi:type I restriction enzyme S subunit
MRNVKAPEGWTYRPLSDLADVQTGIAKGKEVNGSAVSLPYLRVANVQDGHVDLSTIKEILVSSSEVDRYSLQANDVLFTEGGDFDKLGRGTVWYGQIQPCLHQNHIFAVRPHPNQLVPEFLAYQASSDYGRRYFQLSSKQSTNLASINSTQLKAFPVLSPPLPEQLKITRVLQTWDRALAIYERLIAAKQVRANAFSRQCFEPCHPTSKTRPSNWLRYELGDVFKERDEPGLNDDKLLSITMSGGVIDREESGRKDTSNEDKSAYKLILPGDIGYNTMRMWQGVCGLSRLRGIVSPAYTIVTPDNRGIAARYAAHLFKSRRMVFDFERYSQGLTSDTWNLKFPAFRKIVVYLPPIDVQRRQAELFDTLFAEIAALEKQREAVAKQKRGLMQKLLTGEWRVNANAEVAA